MTTSAPYYHVDAFAERPFTGNQAAVLLLETKSAVRFRTRHVGLVHVRRSEHGFAVALPAIATTHLKPGPKRSRLWEGRLPKSGVPSMAIPS